MKKLLAMVLAMLMMASIFTVAASADNDYAGEKLVIWTCLTADAQYEVLNKQFTNNEWQFVCFPFSLNTNDAQH